MTQAETPAEFKSVILTVDAVSGNANEHVVQKFVASTQDLTETMLALFGYYKEDHLLHSAATIRQFQLLPQTPLPAFVYRTPQNVQIVLDTETFNRLCMEHGSVLAASMSILDVAGKAIVDIEKASGSPVPLILFSFEEETINGHQLLNEEAAAEG